MIQEVKDWLKATKVLIKAQTLILLIWSAFLNQHSYAQQGLRILGTAEDYSGVRGVLFADIYGVSELDPLEAISYQWLSNGTAISGATNQTLDVGDYFDFVENKDITVRLTYTDKSGQEATSTSAVMPFGGFRIVGNAEDGRNEWQWETASEEVDNSVNPYPLVESYSVNGTSSTSGTSAGSAHNITSVKASEEGITAREGENVIRIYANGNRSNRSELAHLNNETKFQEDEDYYFSGSFYASREEWDPITEGGSTVITQLKQYGGGSPNFELRLSNEGDYKMTWRAVPHDINRVQDLGYAKPDAWNDLKIYTKHSQGNDGVFKVWLNSKLVIDYQGSTMYRDDDGYIKFGMYTEIYDERVIYWDAIDISDHLTSDFNTWLNSGNNLPSVTLNGISDQQQFANSESIVISGTASDPSGDQLGSVGGIQSVELFADGTRLKSTNDASFNFTGLNLSNGEHTLRVVAADTDGNTAEKTFSVWIGNRPAQISIDTSTYFLGAFNTQSEINLTATAFDPDGSLSKVAFIVNGQLIGTASHEGGNQYSLSWTPSVAGAYSIQAQATDNQGAVTLSDSKAVLIGSSITTNTLKAIQDVTIEQGSSRTGNWSETEIYGSETAPKVALIEFDLSSITSAKYIQSSTFHPYVTYLKNSPGTFSIYATETKIWSQDSVNWNRRPNKGSLLDTITIDTTGEYASFNVRDALQKAIDDGLSKITLWVEDTEQKLERFDFASENNSRINKPAELRVQSATQALPDPVKGSYELSSKPDTSAPTFAAAATSSDGSKVILTYDEALSATTASATDFVVKIDGSTASIASVTTSGSTVELTLSPAIRFGQSVTIAYTDLSTGNDTNAIQDTAGNDAASLSSTAVTNIADPAAEVVWIEENWSGGEEGVGLRTGLIKFNGNTIRIGPFANISDVNLSGADLSAADLSHAAISNADLSNANLFRANFSGASFQGVNLSGTTWNTPDPRIAELEAQLAAMTAERDARPTQAAHNEVIAQRDARPTIEEMQDARLGSIVLQADAATNNVKMLFSVEETDDLKSWTKRNEINEITIPLEVSKRFYRFVLEEK